MESSFLFDQDESAACNTAFQSRLLSLQCLIGELLLKNQQLRERIEKQWPEPSIHFANVRAVQVESEVRFKSSEF
jgi:hypothetical protein